MSIVTLIEAKPRRAADGVVQTLRLVANSRKRADFFDLQWLPNLILVPGRETRLGFDGASFANGSQTPQIGQFNFVLDATTQAFAGHVWKNAEIIVRRAAWPAGTALVDPADGDFTARSYRADIASAKDGLLTVTMLDPGLQLARPVSQRLFGTSGDALLDGTDAVEFKGQNVPMGWGELLNIHGKLIDRTYGIYLLLGNAATSVQRICDGGADFTLGVSRASLAALRGTAPAAGAADYCLNASGLTLVRPWDAPTYPLTADVTVGSTTIADIANTIVTSRTTLAFTAGAVAAINGVQSSPAQHYVEDAGTIATALDTLFAGVGIFWRLSAAGTIDLIRYGFTAPVRAFGAWEVKEITRRGIVMPTAKRSIGYGHNNHVLGENEVAKIYATENLAYADGTPIEALKPAQAGADVTAANTAAAIAGQGALATLGSADFATQVSGAAKPANNADVTIAQPVVSQLNATTGVINDSRALNANNNFGLRSLIDAPTITDSVVSTLCYINIAAFNVYPDWGGTIAYPSGTIGPVSYATTYFIYRNVASAGSTGTSYGYSTLLSDALGIGRVYFGYILTRATSGSGGTTGGGTGGGGTEFCVAPEAWVGMPDDVTRAADVVANDVLIILADDRVGLATAEVESNVVGHNFVCTITTASGAALTLSVNTPVPSRTGGYVMAANAWLIDVPVLRGDVLTWEPVVSVVALGLRPVQQIRCHQQIYAAGNTPDALIMTHNPYHKP